MGDKTFTSNGVTYSKSRLFFVSVLALATSGLVFSIRTDIMLNLQQVFFEPISRLHAAELVGAAVATLSLGLAIGNFVAGPLCDWVGMKRLLFLASLLHIAGVLTIIFTPRPVGGYNPYWMMWSGYLLAGLAHGIIEGVINPLTTTLYPDDKTHKLNVLHAWWPGGLIIGGLLAYGLGRAGVSWQIKQGIILLPAVAYGIMVLASKFPPTERVAAGVSDKEMFKEVFRPLFILWWICMWFTATTELTTGGWIDAFLRNTVGMKGVLLLVYWSALMFVGRHFAGGLAHKLSPVGLMWFSSLLAGFGLLILSVANSPVSGIIAATVFGLGVCYMWPTMLAVASERFPKGGALILGLMGTAGNLSVYVTMKYMGRIFDIYKEKAAEAAGTTFDALSALPGTNPQLVAVLKSAAAYSFRWMAVLPAVLLVVFGLIWLSDKARGGYKAVKLTTEAAPAKDKVKV